MKTFRPVLLLLAGLFVFGTQVLWAQAPASPEKKNYIYTLTLADKIRVGVYQEEDLTSTTRIDAHGHINLPLIGEIAVGGMTVTEAQTAIENAYKDGRFLRNPQVTVTVEDYAAREVSIQGQIRNPGRYSLPIESTWTVVELVTKAGGISDIGKGSAVSVTRVLPDGSKKVFTIDVDNVIKGRKDKKNDDNTLLLQPGDVVYVPEKLI